MPDYHQIISNPIDLGTMAVKVEKSFYSTVDQFAADLKLLIDNALLYNPPGTFCAKTAQKVSKKADELLPVLRKKVERLQDAVSFNLPSEIPPHILVEIAALSLEPPEQHNQVLFGTHSATQPGPSVQPAAAPMRERLPSPFLDDYMEVTGGEAAQAAEPEPDPRIREYLSITELAGAERRGPNAPEPEPAISAIEWYKAQEAAARQASDAHARKEAARVKRDAAAVAAAAAGEQRRLAAAARKAEAQAKKAAQAAANAQAAEEGQQGTEDVPMDQDVPEPAAPANEAAETAAITAPAAEAPAATSAAAPGTSASPPAEEGATFKDASQISERTFYTHFDKGWILPAGSKRSRTSFGTKQLNPEQTKAAQALQVAAEAAPPVRTAATAPKPLRRAPAPSAAESSKGTRAAREPSTPHKEALARESSGRFAVVPGSGRQKARARAAAGDGARRSQAADRAEAAESESSLSDLTDSDSDRGGDETEDFTDAAADVSMRSPSKGGRRRSLLATSPSKSKAPTYRNPAEAWRATPVPTRKQLQPGTAVWAKQRTFPYWPAEMFEEDSEEVHDRIIANMPTATGKGFEAQHFPVRFFDDRDEEKRTW